MTEERVHYDMIAVDALRELPLAERVQAVLKAFDKEERKELAAWFSYDDEEKDPA